MAFGVYHLVFFSSFSFSGQFSSLQNSLNLWIFLIYDELCCGIILKFWPPIQLKDWNLDWHKMTRQVIEFCYLQSNGIFLT